MGRKPRWGKRALSRGTTAAKNRAMGRRFRAYSDRRCKQGCRVLLPCPARSVPQAGHLPAFISAMRDRVVTGRWTGDEQMDRYDHLWVVWVTPQGRCVLVAGMGAHTVRYPLVCQHRQAPCCAMLAMGPR